MSPAAASPPTPAFAHLFTLRARLASAIDAGDGPLGRRALYAVSSGQFDGERLAGRVMPGAGDWMLTRNGIRVVDARIVLSTEDGEIIHMSYGGRIVFPRTATETLRDPAKRHSLDPGTYYFRTNPTFETGSSKYGWLNGVVAFGIGALIEGGVAYDVFELQ